MTKSKLEEHYESALDHIVAVLGPGAGDCSANKCDGCRYEMREALEVAREALKDGES